MSPHAVLFEAQIAVVVPVVGAVGVVDREDRSRHQRRGDHTVVSVLGVRIHEIVFRVGGREAGAVFQPLALAVDIGPHSITLEIRSDDRSLAVEVVGAYVIAQRLGAARNRKTVLVRQSRAEDGVLPIGVGQRTALVFEIGGDDGRNLVIARCPAFIVGIVDRPRRHLRQIGVVARLLVELRELVGIEHIIGFRHARYAELAVVTDHGMFVLAALGRDEDNAARTARTVDRRRRSVLEHFKTLDVVAVEVREGTGVARNAVDDVERVVARRGGLGCRGCGSRRCRWAGRPAGAPARRHLGGHGVAEIGCRKPFEILGLDRRDRRRHVALVLHAVAYDHHVVHGDRLAFQRDVGLRLGVRKCDGYLVITDQRYFEHRVFLADRQHIFAV